MSFDLTCRHESAHAVIARALNVQVVRATVADGAPYVRTRFRYGPNTPASVMIRSLEREAIVALAGAAVEQEMEAAADADQENALHQCLRIILLQDAIGDDHLTDISARQLARAEELLDQLLEKAVSLVNATKPAITRVANALAERGELDQAEIDAAIGAA
jgi:hypothetical protein